MNTRPSAVVAALLAGIVLTVTLPLSAGCSPESDVAGEADVTEETTPTQAPGGVDAEWLASTWTVDHTLDEISSVLYEDAADQGQTVTVVTIEGDQMQALVEDVTYAGPVVFGGENFRFEGFATYVDDDGSVTESDIIIDGVRTGDDSWEAEMWGEVRTDGEPLYEATWTQTAARLH